MDKGKSKKLRQTKHPDPTPEEIEEMKRQIREERAKTLLGDGRYSVRFGNPKRGVYRGPILRDE